jgi:hypothetical protein
VGSLKELPLVWMAQFEGGYNGLGPLAFACRVGRSPGGKPHVTAPAAAASLGRNLQREASRQAQRQAGAQAELCPGQRHYPQPGSLAARGAAPAWHDARLSCAQGNVTPGMTLTIHWIESRGNTGGWRGRPDGEIAAHWHTRLGALDTSWHIREE